MKERMELAGAWSGVVFVVLFFVGFLLLAQWVPPLGPALSAEQIASRFEERRMAIRAGLALAFIGCMCFLSFGAVLANQTRRIERATPSLCYLQLVSVAASAIILIIPIMLWWAAAFRPERDPQLVQLLNDVAAIIFVVGFVPYITWAVAVGLAILSDTGSTTLFPRWAGYLSLFVALGQIQGFLLAFNQHGPFAWNGVFSWWTPLTVFFVWIVVMIVLTVRSARAAVSQEEARAVVLQAAR